MADLLKSDLVNLARPGHLTKIDSEYVVNGLLNVLEAHLQTPGNRVVIRGLGTFYTTEQAEHTGRNPRTGASVQVPRKRRLRFTPSEVFFKEKK